MPASLVTNTAAPLFLDCIRVGRKRTWSTGTCCEEKEEWSMCMASLRLAGLEMELWMEEMDFRPAGVGVSMLQK